MRSGCEFCWELEAGVVFWLSPLSVGQGKKWGKLSLVLKDGVYWKVGLCKAEEACRLL